MRTLEKLNIVILTAFKSLETLDKQISYQKSYSYSQWRSWGFGQEGHDPTRFFFQKTL